MEVREGVEVADSQLRQKALVGSLATGRARLGYFPNPWIGKVQGKERHHILKEEV